MEMLARGLSVREIEDCAPATAWGGAASCKWFKTYP